jgi:hypothetical protein
VGIRMFPSTLGRPAYYPRTQGGREAWAGGQEGDVFFLLLSRPD